MDLPTQEHLTQLRGLLLHRLGELRAEVHAAELARREPMPGAAHEVIDRKEEADARQDATVADLQEQRDLAELAEAEAALQRLEDGRYGDCLGCGEPIPLQRLRVQPAAARCAACQARLEPRRGHA